MIRRVSIIVIICYLFLDATFVNAHNHPISEGNKDSCPAYILSHSFNSDTAFNNTFLIEYSPEKIEYLQIIKENYTCHIIYLSINNRAPPLPNQIWFPVLRYHLKKVHEFHELLNHRFHLNINTILVLICVNQAEGPVLRA